MVTATVHDAGVALIKANWQAEPGIVSSYLFPSDTEIRIVHLDENVPALIAGDRIQPFYFRAMPNGEIPFDSSVAIIRPEERDRLSPPEGWGNWEDAQQIHSTRG